MAARQFAARLLVGAVVVCGCGSADRSAALVATRDSAGVIIVESAAPSHGASDPQLRIAAEPAIDIGVAEGDPAYELTGVVGAIRLAGGQIVVASATLAELRFYDGNGRHIRTVGRSGAGPGEFRNLGGVYRLGTDSIVTWDRALRRGIVFDTAGVAVRSFVLESPEGALRPALAGVLDDGTLLVHAAGSVTPEVAVGVERVEGVVARHEPDGVVLEMLAPLASEEWALIEAGGERALTMRAFARNGYVATDGSTMYFGDSDWWQITALDVDGARPRLIRRTTPPVPLTPEMIERHRADRLDGVHDAQARQALMLLLDGMPYPETLPAFGRLIAARDGRLWVESVRPPGTERVAFSIHDAEGAWIQEVVVPPGLHIFEVGPDYVLGRWRDELDVQHVRLYALEER